MNIKVFTAFLIACFGSQAFAYMDKERDAQLVAEMRAAEENIFYEYDHKPSFRWTSHLFLDGEGEPTQTFQDAWTACQKIAEITWPHLGVWIPGIIDTYTGHSTMYGSTWLEVQETMNTGMTLDCYVNVPSYNPQTGEFITPYPGYRHTGKTIHLHWPDMEKCEKVNEFEPWDKQQMGYHNGQTVTFIDAAPEGPNGRWNYIHDVSNEPGSPEIVRSWIDEHGIARTNTRVWKSDLTNLFGYGTTGFVYKIRPKWHPGENDPVEYGCVSFK